ncbi:CBS domain-containing protein [Paracoccus sediminis]|nr:CBS domain-containing protein [Paracoccus sediminis]
MRDDRAGDLAVADIQSLKASDHPDALLQLLSSSTQDVFPVLDDRGRVVGTIGEPDLLRVLSPSEPTLSFGPGKLIREGLIDTIEDMMTRRPLTCRVSDPIHAALKKMATLNIAQLVVIDDNDTLVGLLRARDLFKALFGKDRP